MNRTSVQIIRVPGRDVFLEECLHSLCTEPVAVMLDNLGAHLATRLDFIDNAVTEFVSFVDSHDLVVPGVFEKLYMLLDTAEPDTAVGAYSHEIQIKVDGSPYPIEHLAVNVPFQIDTALTVFHFPRVYILRTDVAQQVSKLLRNAPETYIYPEFTVAVLASLVGQWLELPEAGCKHRIYSGGIVNTMSHSWFKNDTRKFVRRVQAALAQQHD
jgi:hypothetical protein